MSLTSTYIHVHIVIAPCIASPTKHKSLHNPSTPLPQPLTQFQHKQGLSLTTRSSTSSTAHRRRLDKSVQIHGPLIPIVHIKALYQREEEEAPIDKSLGGFLGAVDAGQQGFCLCTSVGVGGRKQLEGGYINDRLQ